MARSVPRPTAPPDAAPTATVAQLKDDIDSGRTGDKVPVFDPGLSPLGTDDEAAGAPPSPEEVAAVRRLREKEAAAIPGAEPAARSAAPAFSTLPLWAIVAVAVVFFALMAVLIR